jgi:DNA-binding transcriptional LysR family regulator
VTTPLGTSTRTLVESAFAESGVTPLVAVETDQREAILPLVLEGAGATFLPRPMVEPARRTGAVAVELRPRLRRSIGLVHRPPPVSPATAAFVAVALGGDGP